MSSGQMLSLCLFYTRLSWEKGKATAIPRHNAVLPSEACLCARRWRPCAAAHFVGELRAEGARAAPCTGAAQCTMQAPHACLLCSKDVVYPPALWSPCDPEHSWAEAMKCVLWNANQVQGFPMLRAWRRTNLTNFTAALTYSKPGHGHFGRMKVCMRHLVGCMTCDRCNWIDNVVSCF